MRYYEGKNGYEMKEEINNVFRIKVEGFFNETIGMTFLKDYNTGLKMFDSRKTNLIIESQNLLVSTQKMLDIMNKCYELYNSSNFKKMIIVLPDSPVASMQAKRKAQDAGYNGDFAKSLDEAYSLINT
jgi:hypothetical protein